MHSGREPLLPRLTSTPRAQVRHKNAGAVGGSAVGVPGSKNQVTTALLDYEDTDSGWWWWWWWRRWWWWWWRWRLWFVRWWEYCGHHIYNARNATPTRAGQANGIRCRGSNNNNYNKHSSNPQKRWKHNLSVKQRGGCSCSIPLERYFSIWNVLLRPATIFNILVWTYLDIYI